MREIYSVPFTDKHLFCIFWVGYFYLLYSLRPLTFVSPLIVRVPVKVSWHQKKIRLSGNVCLRLEDSASVEFEQSSLRVEINSSVLILILEKNKIR